MKNPLLLVCIAGSLAACGGRDDADVRNFDARGTMRGLTEYHWVLELDEAADVVTRIPVQLAAGSYCTIVYAQISGESEYSVTQMVSDTILPPGTSPSRIGTQAGSGSPEEVTYIDAIGYRSMERSDGGYLSEVIQLEGQSAEGQLVITQISSSIGDPPVPVRRGSIVCDREFDIVDATLGTEVEFFDISNAVGIAHDGTAGASASVVGASLLLESPVAGVLLTGDGNYTAATVDGPEGSNPVLLAGFHDFVQGPGVYDIEMNTASDRGSSWFIAGYGMNRSLDLAAVRVESLPFEEICFEGMCLLH